MAILGSRQTPRRGGTPNRVNQVTGQLNIPCPYCSELQRSVGWLCWHIKHKHTLVELVTYSPACERGNGEDSDKFVRGSYGANVCRTAADVKRVKVMRSG